MKKLFLDNLSGTFSSEKSIWLMRQAGRYLPEYKEVRKNFKSFIDFCLNTDAAAEVTIQPLRRFPLDAAIIFSDILIVPHALGIKVEFKENHGPILDKINNESDLNKLKSVDLEVYNKVGKAIKLVKDELYVNYKNTALIGFAGSPFTVASYMVEGQGSKNFQNVIKLIYQNPKVFDHIINLVTETTIEYLKIQIENGAEAIKLFDSWAGFLPEIHFDKYVIKPTSKIVKQLKEKYPKIPIIGFARSSGIKLKKYAQKTNLNAIAIDQFTPLSWVKKNIQINATQGNLDNMLLAYGEKEEIKKVANKILNYPNNIFNLGHGVLPETPIDNVKMLVDIVKSRS